MTWETELYVVKLSMPGEIRYSKDMRLNEVKEFLSTIHYGMNYDKYIEPGLLYFTEDINKLRDNLGVDKVAPMGLYIRGVYGGEERGEEGKYAGLALEQYHMDGAVFRFKLSNTRDELVVPLELMRKYGIDVYKMVYVGEINPFRLNRYLDVLLSRKGEDDLKQFLREALKINKRNVSEDTQRKIEGLIDELKQPSTITTFNTSKYYVVYRCDRAFTACMISLKEGNIIAASNVSYVECSNADMAYYYSAVLNYLAFKVIEHRRTFNRHQYARPLLAVLIAGLSWGNLDEETRMRIVKLSKVLHDKAPQRNYANQRMALIDISLFSEFNELVHILDSKVDIERLEKALKLVS
jgi:hypothetical protein